MHIAYNVCDGFETPAVQDRGELVDLFTHT